MIHKMCISQIKNIGLEIEEIPDSLTTIDIDNYGNYLTEQISNLIENLGSDIYFYQDDINEILMVFANRVRRSVAYFEI